MGLSSSISIILLATANFAFGQSFEILQFQEKVFDFGTINEVDGPVIHEFVFTNTSSEVVSISKVIASCGCTTPGWSEGLIEPGKTGFIQAKYNPDNRPGKFNKYLTVSLSNSEDPIRLFIKGFVTPKPKEIEDELRVSMGNLKVKYKSLNLGKLYSNQTDVIFDFDLYNSGDETIVFGEHYESPYYILLEVEPKELKPLEKGILKLKYNPKATEDLGFRNDNITLYTNEKGVDSLKSFSVYANILEFFPRLTEEQLANAPIVSFNKLDHDFDKIESDKKAKTSFLIKNDGIEDLIIRKAEGNCSCVKTSIDKVIIKSGESSELKVELDPTDRVGRQQKAVVIYSNAPRTPVTRLILNAYVVSD